MKNIRNMDVQWDYQGDRGPEKWHTLCEWFASGASFPYQSPINLSKDSAIEDSTIKEITFFYQREEFTEKEFKNTFHFVPPEKKSAVFFNECYYFLTDIHFHTPSEHSFDEQHYPIEFHLVHMNDKGENLVVACLFELTQEKNKFSREASTYIWKEDTHQQWFNPTIFLPQKKAHFHYTGSLTTPPTKGPVFWFVFDEIQEMSFDFFECISEGMLAFNSRPIQKLNDRATYFFK